MIAHIRQNENITQSAKEHSENVKKLAGMRGCSTGLEATAMLAGVLHDMGKFTKPFNQYLLRPD